MCLAVYLSTEQPLHSVSTDSSAYAPYFELLPAKHVVRRQFSLPTVYHVGSHEGCGCGFFKEGEVGEELGRCQANYAAVANAVREAFANGECAELFASWEGDQGEKPKFIDTVTLETFESPNFQLKELQLLRFVERDA